MKQVLLVATSLQAIFFNQYLKNEMQHGFWSGGRPAGHEEVWDNVIAEVTTDDNVGCVGFKSPRLYNFINEVFIELHKDKLIELAKQEVPNANYRTVKPQLARLSQIVGGRLVNLKIDATRANRGNNVHGIIHGEERPARLDFAIKKKDHVVKTISKSNIFSALGL